MTASLGIGTATFIPNYGFSKASPDSALIRIAIQNGIRYIDTAANYGGASEALSRLLDCTSESSVRIATKIPAATLDVSPLEAEATIRQLVRSLNQPRVDSLLLHSATLEDVVNRRVVESIQRAEALGLTIRSGASTYGIPAAQRALSQAWCTVVQVEHSILNPSVVRACSIKRPGQELVVRSVLCKGLLTTKRHSVSQFSSEAKDLVDRLERLAAEWHFTLEELAIRFALDTPNVDIVLVGIASPDELTPALNAVKKDPLQPLQLEKLSEFDCSEFDWTHPEKWT